LSTENSSSDARRIAALEANLAQLAKNLTPHQPTTWEMQAEVLRERDELRLKVAELEAQMDELIDALPREVLRATPSAVIQRRPGRPKGARDKAPRRRRLGPGE
jgi:hypothetical protein